MKRNEVIDRLAIKVEDLIAKVRKNLKSEVTYNYVSSLLSGRVKGKSISFIGSWRTLEAFIVSAAAVALGDPVRTIRSMVALSVDDGGELSNAERIERKTLKVVEGFMPSFVEENRDLLAECVLAGPEFGKRRTPH